MIKQVRITNFKSLVDVTVDLDPVTVLIGRSGTGKSNFVQALRFLRDTLAIRNPSEASHVLGGAGRIVPAVASPDKISSSFTIVFDVEGVTGDYQYHLSLKSASNSLLMPDEEKLTLGSNVLFSKNEHNWIEKPKVAHPPPPSGIILGTLTGIQEASIAHLVLSKGIGCYDFPEIVLMFGNDPSQGDRGLADSGANYFATLDAIIGNLQTLKYWREIIAALRVLNPSIKTVEFQMPSKNKVIVSHAVNGKAIPLDVSQESAGFRRFLAHLIALYQSPPKQTLIFEEPEKGIHPGALEALADQFKACPKADRGQVLLTTHSPQLLDCFEPEMLRVVTMHEHQTKIGPVAPEQIEAVREQLMTTGELLTVDPARLAEVSAV